MEQNQADINEATILAQQLQSADEVERKQAKKEIRLLTEKSAESRGQVIRELIKLIERSNSRLRLTSEEHYDAWSFAVELLGELKATESIATLVTCISCNDGTGGLSVYRHPALRAIIKIGPEAIPKLREALSSNDPATREYSALALGEIGGTEARAALENALLNPNHELESG